MKNIYHYNTETGEFKGETNARIDPLESKKAGKNVFLISANATEIKPPDTNIGEVAIFKGGKWSVVADHRGEKYYFPDGKEEHICYEIGDLPEGAIVGDRVIPDGEKWETIRNERNEKLATTDWTVLPDSPLTPEDQNKFMTYRQELRDVPQANGDPDNINWPAKP
jgi:hypothetical protein